MFKKVMETLIGGAIGAAAIYIVGRLAYQAGQEMAREECRYHAMQTIQEQSSEKVISPASDSEENSQAEPVAIVQTHAGDVHQEHKKQSKLGMLFGMKRIFGNRNSVLGGLVRDPEGHRIEAYVEGDELQIHVKRKDAS